MLEIKKKKFLLSSLKPLLTTVYISDENLETNFLWSLSPLGSTLCWWSPFRSRGDVVSVSCFLNWSRDRTFLISLLRDEFCNLVKNDTQLTALPQFEVAKTLQSNYYIVF